MEFVVTIDDGRPEMAMSGKINARNFIEAFSKIPCICKDVSIFKKITIERL